MKIIFTIIGILALLLGLSFIGGAIVLCLRKWVRIKKSAATTGVVVDNQTTENTMWSDSSPNTTLYKPTVRFQTADGRVVDYTPAISTNISNYRVGENVPVYYNLQKPEEAIVGTAFRLWFALFVFGLVGGVFALVGAMFIVMTQGSKIVSILLR